MKILIIPYNFHHQPIAGGEIYLTRLITHLRKSHEIRIITGHGEYYEHEGLPCYPQQEMANLWLTNNEHFVWCDMILTHLIGTSYAYNKSIQHKKPIVFIAHNNSKNYAVKYAENCHVIYNSYQLEEDLRDTFGHFPFTVLHPLIPAGKLSKGKCVTMVNMNENKGGHLFIQIAKLLPQIKFIGVVGGYSDQIIAQNVPNITYLPNGTDMAKVYAKTSVLLVLSEFESYSQCAIEAMNCGIPVIAHPTPGVKENLAYAGIYINRNNINEIANKILYLINNRSEQSALCLQRANNTREMSAGELEKFDRWIEKVK